MKLDNQTLEQQKYTFIFLDLTQNY